MLLLNMSTLSENYYGSQGDDSYICLLIMVIIPRWIFFSGKPKWYQRAFINIDLKLSYRISKLEYQNNLPAIYFKTVHMICTVHVIIVPYSDVIMSAMASSVTGVSIVYSTICSGTDQRKYQSSASLAFVRGIHWWLVTFPHKGL